MKRANFDFTKMAEQWPSALVARSEVGKFSGGILNPRTMANLDCMGKGVKDRVRIGKRRIAYPVESLIKFLEDKSTQL
ncbi:MAG: hypothetical protein JW920_07715 [Deltaproteobacteria bacterium]|nr:hypothetical protein [Deltaproteobacteria bacterium]